MNKKDYPQVKMVMKKLNLPKATNIKVSTGQLSDLNRMIMDDLMTIIIFNKGTFYAYSSENLLSVLENLYHERSWVTLDEFSFILVSHNNVGWQLRLFVFEDLESLNKVVYPDWGQVYTNLLDTFRRYENKYGNRLMELTKHVPMAATNEL